MMLPLNFTQGIAHRLQEIPISPLHFTIQIKFNNSLRPVDGGHFGFKLDVM